LPPTLAVILPAERGTTCSDGATSRLARSARTNGVAPMRNLTFVCLALALAACASSAS